MVRRIQGLRHTCTLTVHTPAYIFLTTLASVVLLCCVYMCFNLTMHLGNFMEEVAQINWNTHIYVLVVAQLPKV